MKNAHIVERAYKIARRIAARTYSHYNAEITEDVCVDLALSAGEKYDPTKAKLETYISFMLGRRFYDAIRSSTKGLVSRKYGVKHRVFSINANFHHNDQCNRPGHQATQLVDYLSSDGSSHGYQRKYPRHEQEVDTMDLQEVICVGAAKGNERHQEVFERMCVPKTTMFEAADLTGMSESRVCQLMGRLKDKASRVVGDERVRKSAKSRRNTGVRDNNSGPARAKR